MADGEAGWVGVQEPEESRVGVKYIEILFLLIAPCCLLLCCAVLKAGIFFKYLKGDVNCLPAHHTHAQPFLSEAAEVAAEADRNLQPTAD